MSPAPPTAAELRAMAAGVALLKGMVSGSGWRERLAYWLLRPVIRRLLRADQIDLLESLDPWAPTQAAA